MYHKHYDFSQVDALKEKIIGDTNAHYIGRILTIIDASVTGDQGKALKDLIKKEMWEYLQDSFEDSRRLMAHVIRAIEDVWVKETLKTTGEELKDFDLQRKAAAHKVSLLWKKKTDGSETKAELVDHSEKYNLSDSEKKMVKEYESSKK